MRVFWFQRIPGFVIEGSAGHHFQVTFALQACPQEDANKDETEEAQRNGAVTLYAADVL
jgi:hypothetical protein